MKRLRLGILSTAGIARRAVIPAFQACERVDVAGIASRDRARAERCADEMGIARVYDSYEDLIDDPEIDAVYNPLPTSMHAAWSLRCAEAGKAVLCEKPLCANYDDAWTLVNAFQSRGLILAEAMMFRYHPQTLAVRRWIESGRIGRVKLLRSHFVICNPYLDDHRRKPEAGGGALLDVGVYCVSAARYFTGEEPERVLAAADWLHANLVDESLSGILKFPSGAIAYLGCSISAFGDCMVEISGTEGRILVPQMVASPGGPTQVTVQTRTGTVIETIEAANHYQLMAEDFAAAILDRRPLAYPVEDVLATQRVMDQLFSSARM